LADKALAQEQYMAVVAQEYHPTVDGLHAGAVAHHTSAQEGPWQLRSL
jgi:hypothetical protein